MLMRKVHGLHVLALGGGQALEGDTHRLKATALLRRTH
jgi:hypothetical protein